MLGFTKEWIPLLEQGGAAMSGLTAEAQAAGGVIDDATIKKAAEFNAEWTKSSAIFSVTMKAALVDLLPFVDELIQRAQKFADIKPGAGLLDSLTQTVAGGTLRQLATTDLEVKSEVTDSWSKLSETVYTLYAFFRAAADDPAIHQGIENLVPSTPEFLSNNSVYKTNSVFPDSQDPMNSDGYKKSGPLNYDALQKQIDAADDAAGDAADAYTKVASRGTATNDAVDKAINTLNRHTLQTVADTQAVGLGADALATFRAEAAETAAIQANGGEITAKQKAQFDALTVSAGLAADALAKAKVSSDIQFSVGSSLLSSEDTKIAQQLKGIYGNDIPAALDSSYAAAIRVNDAFKEVSSGIENSMVSSLTDITTGAKSASQGFTDMSNAIIKAIEQMIIKITIVEPLMRGLQGALGGFGGLNVLTGSANPLSGFGSVPSAHGNVFSSGNVVPFAQGGVIDGPHVAPMALMGEAGPEAIVPLRRGADGNLGIASAGGGGKAPTIVINNHTDAQPQVSQGSNGDITITLKKMVDGAVGDSLSSGSGMRVLNKQYGVKQFAGQ